MLASINSSDIRFIIFVDRDCTGCYEDQEDQNQQAGKEEDGQEEEKDSKEEGEEENLQKNDNPCL